MSEGWQRSQELIDATNQLLYPLQQRLPAVDSAPLPRAVYHYTDAYGLLGIVKSGQLWASDYRYMNDSEELRYVFRLAADVAGELVASGEHDAPVAQAFLEAAASGPDPFADTPFYLVCFSADGDSLSQWRAYGGSQGFCLELPGDISQPLFVQVPGRQGQMYGLSLLEVIYDEARQRRYVRDLLELILKEVCPAPVLAEYPTAALAVTGFMPFYLGQLERAAHHFKHGAFSDEREWRLIVTAPHRPNEPPRILPEFRVSRTLTPYLTIQVDSATHPRPNGRGLPLLSVTHGPTPLPSQTAVAMDGLLKVTGYPQGYCARRGSRAPARL